MENNNIGRKMWTSVILFGLIGQVAWIVENMYFNVFIDRMITPNPTAIWVMVAASAIVATFATLIAGTWSDKIGMRRKFMSYGYLIWGLIIMSFALISVENTQKLFSVEQAPAIVITTAIVVVMDCIMTYVGSTANDAAFNAWVTDNTTNSNRGRVEGVLAVMPLLAMAAVFGGLDFLTQDTFRYFDPVLNEWVEKIGSVAGGQVVKHGNWVLFYCILGGVVMAVGLLGLFLIKDSPELKPNSQAQFKDMFYGFRKQVVKKNKNLYFTYISMAVVGIANNAYLPYIILYVDRTLGYTNYILPVGAIIVLAAIGSVVFGIFMDKVKDRRIFMVPLVLIYSLGAILMVIMSPLVFHSIKVPMVLLGFAGFVLMGSNLCLAAVLTATVRDLTPPDTVGMFQGVRMFFWVLLPMVIGPLITVIINVDSPVLYVDYYGAQVREYTPYMFLVAAIIGIFAIIPIIFLKKASIEDMTPYSKADCDASAVQCASENDKN